MDVQQVGQQWTPILIGILGLVVTAAIPIIGFVVKIIFGRIAEVKKDLSDGIIASKADLTATVLAAKTDVKGLVVDEERRRGIEVQAVLTQVNHHYSVITSEIQNLRNDIRDLRDEK